MVELRGAKLVLVKFAKAFESSFSVIEKTDALFAKI